MKVRIERDWARDSYSIHFYQKQGSRLFVVRPMEFVVDEVSEYRPGCDLADKIPPALRVDGIEVPDLFANLAKELARLGFKDTEDVRQLTDVLKAKNEHLEDMRKLVFSKRE